MTRILAMLIVCGAAVPMLAQTAPGAAKPSSTWKVPRTPDGKPDLQGVWSNNSVTPMARPTQWKDKESLTDAEVQELQFLVSRYVEQGGDAIFADYVQLALNLKSSGKYSQTSYDPTTGNYNQFWMAGRDWDHRTSLITNPKNGQMPALTKAAQERRAREGGPRAAASEGGLAGRADSYEDRPLGDRCISFGMPWIYAGYNSYHQITQSRDAVVILQEMIHDARVVPLDGRPHLPSTVRQLHGDSRGRWEGDALVVETTNFVAGFQGSTPDVKLTERFIRESQDHLNWEVTVDDPATWVQPWTFMLRLKKQDEQLFEYACHEGNHSMVGILAGARAEERKAAEPTGKR